MKDLKHRGGARPGSGRPSNDRKVKLFVRITRLAADKLNTLTDNKSEFINDLILKQ